MKTTVGFIWISCLLLLVFPFTALSQVSAVSGSLAGTVYDTSGAVIPTANVTIVGPTGNQVQNTDSQGSFIFRDLVPGSYDLRVEKSGFKAYKASGAQVNVNQTTTVHVTLTVGAATQTVEVSSPAVRIDTDSTNVTTHVTDAAYSKLPLDRNVAGLFYIAAGVAGGGGTGYSNPSISGASGLENLYVADGVNITDAGYSALGVYSGEYGPVGTGINMSFVKEVNIKTAGFEPQYGKATGGVVQIVTKSGTDRYHGALTGFFQPKGFEATRLQPDDFNLSNTYGKALHKEGYDVAGEFGGPVPGVRKHLFFYGSFDPTWNRIYSLAPTASALFQHGPYEIRTNTYSYASKVTYRVNDNHQLHFSFFGDPSHTSNSPWRSLTADNNTRFSNWRFGSKNMVGHYTGTLSPTWLISADFSWNHNDFTEFPTTNLSEIVDQTQTDGLPGQRGEFTPVGLGFEQNTKANTYGLDVATTKTYDFAGGHTLKLGYHYEKNQYDGERLYSGPNSPIPATNATGVPITDLGVPEAAVGQPTNALYYLQIQDSTCTLCPLMDVPGLGMAPVALRQRRGLWGPPDFQTSSDYHAAYVEDIWKLDPHLTLDLGLRWEQQRMTGIATHYSFTDNWLPRIGVTWDPTGSRKTKIYANFARYDYVLPLDMALRSLSSELDFQNGYFAPDFTTNGSGQRVVTINQYGTVTPILDAAHLLTGADGGVGTGIGVSQQAVGTAIYPGTKMEYNDEYMVGIDREIPHGVVFSARYISRRLKRIIEDGSSLPPEIYDVSPTYDYVIGNLGANTDIFTNPIEHVYTPQFDGGGNVLLSSVPSACFASDGTVPYNAVNVTDSLGNVVGSACFNPFGTNGLTPGVPTPDGVPDGFAAPIRNYDAVEIGFNKSFSNNWLVRTNWRIARLSGNYEGAYRNDNRQDDPGISSLYDFTAGQLNLLGDQFKPGPLNTDRLHIVNFYAAYVVPGGLIKGLTMGPGITLQSGLPISKLAAHPAYQNAGEVPLGGRGSLGRTPVTGQVNLHLSYPFKISEKVNLVAGWDFFNIGNTRTIQYLNQDVDLGYLTPNADFLKPYAHSATATTDINNPTFQAPFSMRGMVRLEF
ncbi:MAG: TonB-dependent receptor [Terriglobia bacterium]